MPYDKQLIQTIVRESIDDVVESLSDSIYKKLYQTDLPKLVIDINKLPENDQKILTPYADDKGILIVAEICEHRIIKLVLEISAANNYLEIVKFLVKSGAIINSTLALSNSAGNGHLSVVKFLVESGAKIDSTLALSNSAANGHLAVVKFLVSKYIESNTPIPYSCVTHAHDDVRKFLLLHVSKDRHILFSDKIVSKQLAAAKPMDITTKPPSDNTCKKHHRYDINDTTTWPTNFATRRNPNKYSSIVRELINSKTCSPDAYITKEYNDINRFLFMHASEDKHHLFNDKIVSELAYMKKLLK